MSHQNGYCPMCGQRLLMRHGVRLRPRHAEIFDLIERSGSRGITCDVLAALLYPDKSTPAAKKLIAVHVCQLNEFLVETDLVIAPARWGEPYRIVWRPT